MRGGDWRTKEYKKSATGICFFWTLNILVAYIVSLPVFSINAMTGRAESFSPFEVDEIILFTTALSGIVVEAIADLQKFFFKNNPHNKER